MHRALLALPALALACAEEEVEPTTTEAIGREASASFGGKIKNIRIRQGGGTNNYRVTTELGGDASDVLDEVAEVVLTWNGDTETALELETVRHRGRFVHDLTEDPAGGLYRVQLALTGTDGATTVSETVSLTIEADGSPVAVSSDTLGGDLLVRAVSYPDGDDGDYDLSITASLQVDHVGEDGTTSGHFDWSGSGQARVADRVTPAPKNPTVAADLDEVSLTYGTTVSFAGDPVGSAYDIDAVAESDRGTPLAQGEFAVEMVVLDGTDDNDPSVVSSARNGKGTRSSASNTSSSAPLL
jgi:hypothetical protein